MVKKEITKHQRERIIEIGLFLRNWRLNECLTQHEFSEMADIHRNSIYHIENIDNTNYRLYNILTLIKCVDATGLTLGEFFEGM